MFPTKEESILSQEILVGRPEFRLGNELYIIVL